MKISKIIVLAGVAALLATLFAQNQGVLLRRKMSPNATDAYKMVVKTSQTIEFGGQQMPMDFSVTADLAMKLLSIDKAKNEGALEVKVSNLNMDLSGLPGGGGGMLPELPKELVATGTIDERNRIKMTPPKAGQGMGQMMQMMGMMTGSGDPSGTLGVEFPEKAINIGDSWEVTLPKNPMLGDVETKLTAKLIGEADLNGTPAYQIKLSGKIPVDANTEKIAKDHPELAAQNPMLSQSMVFKGTVDIDGTLFVAKATGITLKIESSQKSNMTIEMAAQGMSLASSGQTKISITKQ